MTDATTIPERPSAIPAEARWDPKDNEWVVGREVAGLRDGPFRYYRPDGTLSCENVYVKGVLEGPFRRLHENGEVSGAGTFAHGQVHGPRSWIRSTGPTTENTIPQGCSDLIWLARRTYDHGAAGPAHFQSREGIELNPDGTPVPPKPPGLPDDAAFWLPDEQWFVGLIASDDANHRVGQWVWWSNEGVLQAQTCYGDDGKELEHRQYRPDGKLELETHSECGRKAEERKFHEDGRLFVERRYTPAGKKSYEAYFSEKGRVRSRVQSAWEGERLLQTEARGEDDTLVHVGVCEGDLVGYCFFRPDGQVQATGAFHQASPTGLWSFFDEAGRLAHQIDLGPLKLKGHQVDEDFDPDWLLGQALLPQASTGPRPLQLDGVEKVDWKNVHGCWSEKVKAFPALLQAMTSPERAVRHVAFGEIQGECEHQGSTYEATARVVPFLVRLLEHENADRKDILDFIYQVGCASSGYVEQVQELEEDDVERIAIEGTYQAVRAGWPSFARLLDDPDPVLRERAILLAAFADRDRVKDAIARAAEHDPEVRLRGVAIQTLLALDGAEPAEALPFLDHPDPVLRLVTATCACKRFGPDAPARSVDVLRECFEQWETLRGRYEELPFVNEHMLADLSIAVGSIRNDQARAMGPALAASLDTVDAFSSIRYARGLFALCFGNGDKPYAACFPEILATVARSQRFFEYVNCNEVLDAWNLPHSAEQLRALAELVAAAPDPEEAMYQKMHEGGEVEGGCDNEEEDDG